MRLIQGRRRAAAFIGLLAAFAVSSREAWPASIQWTGVARDNDWFNASNWSPAQVPASADDAVIDQTATVIAASGSPPVAFAALVLGDSLGNASPTLKVATAITTSGSLTIFSGASLQQDTTQAFSLGQVLVAPGGKITHTANSTTRSFAVNLSVSGDFTLQAGSTIAVDGLGYLGGVLSLHGGSGPGGGGGGWNTIYGLGGPGGGGHGGAGGSGSPTAGGNPPSMGLGGASNDSATAPVDLGSGGGAGFDGCRSGGWMGGAGGGAVILSVAGKLTLDGLVSANGAPGQAGCGPGAGGAGGTINLTASALSGMGVLQANGGAGGGGDAPGGGGAGGRIAVVAGGTDDSNLNIKAANGAAGGILASNGGAGVISLKTPGGTNYHLTIGDPAQTSTSTTNNNIVVFDPAITPTVNSLVIIGTAAAAAASLGFGDNSTLAVSSGAVMSLTVNTLFFGANSPIEIRRGGMFNLAAHSSSGASLNVRSGGLFRQMNSNILGFASVLVEPGAVLTHAVNSSTSPAILGLNVSGDFNLQSGATIMAEANGLAGGTPGQPGSGPGGGPSGGGSGSGGGHGGAGGSGDIGPGGSIYDDIVNPADPGSGGGSGAGARGGAGGGAVQLQVGGTLTANGVLSANGETTNSSGGGGSGGAVNITANNIAGSGIIRANGGSGAASGGSGGGGGRIALLYATRSSSLIVTVSGGSGRNAGAVGTFLDNGKLANFSILGSSSPASLSQLQERLSSSQSLTETISAQLLDFSGAVSTGAVPGILSAAQMHLVTLQTGPFAGQGFFRGSWTFTFPSGQFLTGTWRGAAFLLQSPRRMVIKGSLDGGIRGVLEGTLTETSPGSGVFNVLSAACTVVQAANLTGSAALYFSGTSAFAQAASYPGAGLSLLQSSLTGQASGYAAGPLETTFTLLTLNSPGNPYNGEGFFLPTYSVSSGTGVGWAYAIAPYGQAAQLSGIFDQPLRSLFEGALLLNAPRALLLSLERLDSGLQFQPILTVIPAAPGVANSGSVESYTITIRNDGYAASNGFTVVAEFPEWADFVSASGSYAYYNVAFYRGSGLYAPRPFLRWDISALAARSAAKVSYQARFRPPAAGGPGAHEIINGGQVQLMTKAWADQVFSHYPKGGTP